MQVVTFYDIKSSVQNWKNQTQAVPLYPGKTITG